MRTIESLAAGEVLKVVDEDVLITGDVGPGAQIEVTDGHLTINGKVEKAARINIEQLPKLIVNNNLVFSNNGRTTICASSSQSYKLKILGHIEQDVVINGVNVSFNLQTIGHHAIIETSNGEIVATNLGESVKLKSNNAPIRVNHAAKYCQLATGNGEIEVDGIDDYVKLYTRNSAITVRGKTGCECELETSNGKIRASLLGKSNTLTTTNSSVRIGKAGDNCRITTSNADVEITELGNQGKVRTTNANIEIGNDLPTHDLKTSNGTIVAAGVKKWPEEKSSNRSAGVSFGASGSRGSVVIDGFGNVFASGNSVVRMSNTPGFCASFNDNARVEINGVSYVMKDGILTPVGEQSRPDSNASKPKI